MAAGDGDTPLEQSREGEETGGALPTQEGGGRELWIRIAAGVVFVVITAIGGWWLVGKLGEAEPTPVAAQQEQEVPTTMPGPAPAERVEAVLIERDAPKLTTIRGNLIDFGQPAPAEHVVEATATVRLASGAAEPMLFSSPKIEGAHAASLRVEPLEGGSRGQGGLPDCFQGAVRPEAETGRYCGLRLQWRPDGEPGTPLEATMRWTYAPFQPDRLEGAEGGRTGGWKSTEHTLQIAGVHPHDGAMVEVGGDPQQIAFDVVESPVRKEVKVVVTGGQAVVDRVEIAPPHGGLSLDGADACARAYVPGRSTGEDFCRFGITAQATSGTVYDDHAVRITWHVAQRRGSAEEEAGGWQPPATLGADRREHLIPITGRGPEGIAAAEVAPGLLATSPAALRLGPASTGGAGTQELTITVTKGAAVVTGIRPSWAIERAGVTVRSDAYGTKCERAYRPGATTGEDHCRVLVEWRPGAEHHAAAVDGVLYVQWETGSAAARDRHETPIPIHLTAPEQAPQPARPAPAPAAPRRGSVATSSDEVDFGRHDAPPGPLRERIALIAEDGPVHLVGVEADYRAERRWQGVEVDPADCLGQGAAQAGGFPGGERRLEEGGRCNIVLRWTPDTPQEIEGTLIVGYREAEGGLRKEHTVPVTGELYAPPPITAEQAEAERIARSRARIYTGSAGEAAAGKVVRYERARRSRSLDAQYSWYDRSYAGIGIDPSGDTSTRPVDLTAAVLQGTPIHAVVGHTLDAQAQSPILAYVEADVFAAQGSQVVIPRGSRVVGRTIPIQARGQQAAPTVGRMLASRTGRLKVAWERIILRGHHAAFNVTQSLHTADMNGRPGLPGVVDPKELEIYTGVLSTTAVRALAALLEGTTTTQAVITGTQTPLGGGGGSAAPGGISIEQTVTGEQRAMREIQAGIREITQRISEYVIPMPSVTVYAGTQITLVLTRDLWLRPAARRPAQRGAGTLGGQGFAIPGRDAGAREEPAAPGEEQGGRSTPGRGEEVPPGETAEPDDLSGALGRLGDDATTRQGEVQLPGAEEDPIGPAGWPAAAPESGRPAQPEAEPPPWLPPEWADPA